jgi:HSP20 family molecular chaperone IbpA
LPVEVVGDKAEALYEEGVLRVVIPKAKVEKTKKKKIEIKTKTKK